MSEANGKSRLDRLEDIAATLIEAARQNLDEHERIWKSIEGLKEVQLESTQRTADLVAAIRDLIDRIPPENLK